MERVCYEYETEMEVIKDKSVDKRYKNFGKVVRQAFREGKKSIQDGEQVWMIVEHSLSGTPEKGNHALNYHEIIRSEMEPISFTSFGHDHSWTHEYHYPECTIQLTLQLTE